MEETSAQRPALPFPAPRRCELVSLPVSGPQLSWAPSPAQLREGEMFGQKETLTTRYSFMLKAFHP